MVLYAVVTSFHLLNAVVHKLRFEEHAVLAISEGMSQKVLNIENINQFFDKVVIWNPSYHISHSSKQCLKYIETVVGSLRQYSEIFVWGAQYAFGATLTKNKVPFVYCEEAAGMLSKPEVLMNIVSHVKSISEFAEEAKELGLYNGENVCVLKKLCNVTAQNEELKTQENIIDFDVTKELAMLSPEDRAKILTFFVEELVIDNSPEMTMLLTQHFSNLRILSFEEHCLIYQILVDYFFAKDKLLIKTHPDDLMYYKRLFPEAQIIKDKFPSELTPYILKNPLKRIATIYSTAIHGLKGIYSGSVFELDERFQVDFKFIDRYWGAVKIAEKLKKRIVCINSNELLLEKLSLTLCNYQPAVVLGDLKDRYIEPEVIVIDEINISETSKKNIFQQFLQALNKDTIIIFINSNQEFGWYDCTNKNIWDCICPIVIVKRYIDHQEDFFTELPDENIYIYSSNKEMLNMAIDVDLKKELPYTGVAISNKILTTEQEKICMLEGILEATEKRLRFYMEKVES